MLQARNVTFAIAMIGSTWCIAPRARAGTPLLGTEFFGGTLYDINKFNGDSSNPRNTPAGLIDIEASDAGVVYAISSSFNALGGRLFTINPTTGLGTIVGSTGFEEYLGEGDLSFCPLDGKLYAVFATENFEGGEINLYSVDVDDATPTFIGQVGTSFQNDISALSFDLAGNLFAIDNIQNQLLHLDKTTGSLLSSMTISQPLGSVAGMDVDPETGIMYLADGEVNGTNSLYTIDTLTAELEFVGLTGGGSGLAGLTFIPEPATGLLLSAAAIMLPRRVRRRSR